VRRNGTGGDQFDVTWLKPGDTTTTLANSITNIEAKYIIPELPTNVALSITTNPVSATVVQGRPTNISAFAVGTPTFMGVQWYKDGQPATNVASTSRTLTFASAALSDSGTYYAIFTNLTGSVQTPSVTLTVTPDTTAPTLVSATTTVGTTVTMTFSEALNATNSVVLANYVLTNLNGSTIVATNASLSTDGTVVTLMLSSQVTTNFTIKINNVTDLAGNKVSSDLKIGYYLGLAANLIAYWPLDTNVGMTTPDKASGYDMTLSGVNTNTDILPGKVGNCFYFNGSSYAVYKAATNDSIPAVAKQKNFTVAMWVKCKGTGQSDKRFFYEGYNAALGGNANQPFFGFQTHGSGTDDKCYNYIRQDTGTLRATKPGTTATMLDGTWHHLVWSQATTITATATNVAATCYVDGVADTGMIGAATNGISATVECLGALYRTAAQGNTVCYLDEVAIWGRALTAYEAGLVYTNGVPAAVVIPQALAIKSFKSEFPAATAGSAITLSWAVSKDATSVVITPDVGDVTSVTSAGLGSVVITPTTTKTYTLTITRSAESLTQTLTVPVINSVAAGWTLIDNFDRYDVGRLPTSFWAPYIDNTNMVVEYNGNKMVGATFGAIQSMDLGSYTIHEGEIATLFTRFIATNTATFSNDNFAIVLSDVSPRYAGESWGTLGPGIKFHNPNPSGEVQLYAKDGYLLADGVTTNTVETNANFAVEVGSVYNIWVDITNDTVANQDKFSVYVAKEGTAERTLIFEQLRSERAPVDTSIFGPVKPNLTALFLSSLNSSGATLLFDDLYLSFNAYNSTVPAPYGYTSIIGGEKPTLSAVLSGADVVISWNANNGAGFTLQAADTVTGTFSDVPATPTTVGTTTSVTIPASDAAKFYRLKQ
jgi:hypothetical protein